MRLSEFILKNQEPILQAWEEFARSVDTPMPTMGPLGLRDHAEDILRSVALDMCTSQPPQEQIDKSHGLKPVTADESAAQSHAITRLMAGFTLDQMVSEYRALRSSVLRLWLTQEFSVQNHGKPIPANELPSLFNPERRYSKYSEGEQGASSGLGLGLFIAAQIVEGHGGTIEVESTLERGTIFRVNLPCRNRSP